MNGTTQAAATIAKATANTIAPRHRRSPSAVANSGASAAGPNFAAAASPTSAPRAGADRSAPSAPIPSAAMSESLAFAFITYSVHGQATQAKASAQPSA